MSGAALRQARFDAALTKPIGEARGREGLAILRSRLLLPDLNRVLADVLAAHPYKRRCGVLTMEEGVSPLGLAPQFPNRLAISGGPPRYLACPALLTFALSTGSP